MVKVWCTTSVALLALLAAALPAAADAPLPRTAERVALARAYEHGEGVARNARRAAELYCDAARDGDAEGAFALGWMLANGRGVDRDDAQAVALFAWAARWGHAYAQVMLERLGDVPSPQVPDCLRPRVHPLAWGPPVPAPEIPAPAPVENPPAVPDPFANLPGWKRDVADLVDRLAPRFGIDPRLALSVIAVESNFDPLAVSPKDARGLMQLIPATAARFNVRNAFDPRQNVQGGLAYLRFLLAYYRGDVLLAAAAYNAGEKAVDRHKGIPPFAETQAYVQRVLSLYRSERHPYDTLHAPQPSAVVAPGRMR